ncbi:inactive tyrosine-protein kinase transmembrane receptor ROR1-like [Ptychodera flava]|uniref:inactive tyrosine-protein kinase transmembrane receptor ROR1-like n=1 Tax=Ptychodera flava TaxID=63121 RepID=UPI003969E0B8
MNGVPNYRYETVRPDDSGTYRCTASNLSKNLSSSAQLHISSSIPEDDSRGTSCEPYRGSLCSSFLGTNDIYVEASAPAQEMESRLSIGLKMLESHSDEWSERCLEHAIPFVCYYAFPLCDTTKSTPTRREICYEDCIQIKENICRDEFEMLQLSGIADSMLPDCVGAPRFDGVSNCVKLDIPESQKIKGHHQCYNDTGVTYRGTKNVTESGIPCQPWEANWPHSHSLSPTTYPEIGGGHNYCRNPGNKLDSPWCFTMKEDERVARCNIPRCYPEDAVTLPTLVEGTYFTAANGNFLELVESVNNPKLYYGDKAVLRCRVSGEPRPTILWFKNDAPIKPERQRVSVKDVSWGSKLIIRDVNLADIAYYKCVAENPLGRVSSQGTLYVDVDVDPRPSPNPDKTTKGNGYCKPYTGSVCQHYMKNEIVYLHPDLPQIEIERNLLAAFVVIQQSTDLSPRCEEYAFPSLCYYAFPLCDETSATPKPRELCRDECEVLEEEICHAEYHLAQTNQVITNNVIIPRCSHLPFPGSNASTNCIRLGLLNASHGIIQDHKCYNGSGTSYRGTVNVTKSGIPCQNWYSQVPHVHFLKPATYREIAGDHNFCRNPGGEQAQPWCYTTDVSVRSEPCDIPKCIDIPPDKKSSEVLLILVPSIAVPLLIALLFVCICMCRRQSYMAYNGPKFNGPVMEMSDINRQPQSHAQMQVKEIPATMIRFIQEIGEGAFGKVYQGEVLGIGNDPNGITKVAIKTLKDNASPKVQMDFRREVDLMATLAHPNIVTLLGTCMLQHPHCMIFEFMSQGDLHEFLVRHSPHSDVGSSIDDDTQSSLDNTDFLSIATQIACGMEYLAQRHFVHRDLAARNCLVGDNLVVKIADFGLSRDIYTSDYYRMHSKSLLPVRWMAPESILYGKFTTQSDVWSFGVLLWELFSFGLQPYYGFNSKEVIEMVRVHKILPCPDGCPARMYALMQECWSELPSQRPTFHEISTRLHSWEGVPTMNHNGSLNQTVLSADTTITPLLNHKPATHSRSSDRSSSSAVSRSNPSIVLPNGNCTSNQTEV